MRLHISDWKRACIAAGALFAFASFIVFVLHPGGFEGEIAWFFLLLPGAIVATVLSGAAERVLPVGDLAVYWTLFFTLNFAWYWIISFAFIKVIGTSHMPTSPG